MQIKAGNVHAGFNADLREDGQVVDTIASYSLGWESFATNVCSQAHQPPPVDEYANESIHSIDDDDDNDEDDEDDDSEDDIDDASKFVTNLFRISWSSRHFSSMSFSIFLFSAQRNKNANDNSEDFDSDEDDEDGDADNEIEINSGNDRTKVIVEEVDNFNGRILESKCSHFWQ